jgi:hypothetical protein
MSRAAHRRRADRRRFGLVITVLLLAATAVPLDMSLPEFFAERAVPEATAATW